MKNNERFDIDMDQKNIQHLVDFIRNNPTYTAGELADVALRTGYTQEEFQEALRVFSAPPAIEVPTSPANDLSHKPVDVLPSHSNETTVPVEDQAAKPPVVRQVRPIQPPPAPVMSYLEVAIISILIFGVVFLGLYSYTHGFPQYILTTLGLR